MKNLEETIKLLAHLQNNPHATQRELVEKLDVSLGKVNFLISALAEKGVLKLKKFKKSHNKWGYLYLITPKGIQEKTEITKEFLKSKVEEYDRLKIEIERLKSEMGTNITK